MKKINWLLLFDKALKSIGLSRASVTRYYTQTAAHNLRALENRIVDLETANRKISELRAQLVNVRVAQAERPRMGWEVMCYIPEEVIEGILKHGVELDTHARFIANALVDCALRGIINVNKMGRCNALIFSPLDINKPVEQSKWVVGLFERGGQFTISEKAHAKIERLEDEKKLYREFKPYKPTE